MAFDLSTARPVQQSGFDISTAEPEQQEQAETVQDEDATSTITMNDVNDILLKLPGVPAVAEFMAGSNRTVAGFLDFLLPDNVNALLTLAGSEKRVPTFSDLTVPQGTFDPSLTGKVAGTAGEFAALGAGVGGAIRRGVQGLAAAAPGETALIGTARQLGSTTSKQDVGFGVLSGGGQEAGREAGGETGALIGSIAAPVAAIPAASIAKLGASVVKSATAKVFTKLGGNVNLIDAKSGLPTPLFEAALKNRGLEYGSIIESADNLPVVIGKGNPEAVVERIIKRKLLNRETDDALSILRLEGNKIVSDELGEEAVKQGFRKGDVSATKAMTGQTKKDALEMLNMNRQILSDSSKAQEFRPSEVAGKRVMNQFDFIRGRADTLRLELDKIAKAPAAGERALSGPGVPQGLKGQQINTAEVEDTLLAGLEKLKVNIPDEILSDTRQLNSFLKGNDAFVGSLISENPSSKNIIRKSIKLLSEPGQADALRAHDLKRQLDELIDFNKTGKQGLTESGRNFAKTLRRSLNNSIRDVNLRYGQVNDDLSLSIQSMQEFQKVLGPSIDILAPGANKAVGQDLRGLLSNRKSRVKLENAINNLDESAKKLGGSFDSDVKQLVQFANTLDNRFGSVADTSFKAEITSGIQQASRGTAGAKEAVISEVAKQAEKLRGINDTNAMNVLHKILKR